MLSLKTVNVSGVGTFGALYHNGKPFCKTIEREWKNNKPNISCVPAGLYRLEWHDSPKYGRRLHLVAKSLGVTINGPSQRTHCLFHTANHPDQLEGCVAPGREFAVININGVSALGVTHSKSTLHNLEDLVVADGCDLLIERSFM